VQSIEANPNGAAKVLLRQISTGLYVQAVDVWTGDLRAAFDFESIRRAIQFAESAGLTHMELAFLSDPLGQMTRVPLDTLGWNRSVSHPPEPPLGA
jgi:hypothetical protein